MTEKTNNWKIVTVKNIPDGANFMVFVALKDDSYEKDLSRYKVLAHGSVEGGILQNCYYGIDFIVRVRHAEMQPVEFHSSLLSYREEAIIEMKPDI